MLNDKVKQSTERLLLNKDKIHKDKERMAEALDLAKDAESIAIKIEKITEHVKGFHGDHYRAIPLQRFKNMAKVIQQLFDHAEDIRKDLERVDQAVAIAKDAERIVKKIYGFTEYIVNALEDEKGYFVAIPLKNYKNLSQVINELFDNQSRIQRDLGRLDQAVRLAKDVEAISRAIKKVSIHDFEHYISNMYVLEDLYDEQESILRDKARVARALRLAKDVDGVLADLKQLKAHDYHRQVQENMDLIHYFENLHSVREKTRESLTFHDKMALFVKQAADKQIKRFMIIAVGLTILGSLIMGGLVSRYFLFKDAPQKDTPRLIHRLENLETQLGDLKGATPKEDTASIESLKARIATLEMFMENSELQSDIEEKRIYFLRQFGAKRDGDDEQELK